MHPEYILCAATWYKDFPKAVHGPKNIDQGIVLCGFRHSDIIQQHVKLMGKRQAEMGEYIQGFLTSGNRFVDRKEAAEIALEFGQITVTKKELYSEDLY